MRLRFDIGAALTWFAGLIAVITQIAILLVLLSLPAPPTQELYTTITIIALVEVFAIALLLPLIPRYADIVNDTVIVRHLVRTARVCKLEDISKIVILKKIPVHLLFWIWATGNRGAFGASWCGYYDGNEMCVYTRRTHDLVMLELVDGRKIIVQPRNLQDFLNKLQSKVQVEYRESL